MLSSVVFQKTSPRSLGWNTGRSGFSEPRCHILEVHFGHYTQEYGRYSHYIRDEVIIWSLRDRIALYSSILASQRILLAPCQISFLSLSCGSYLSLGGRKKLNKNKNKHEGVVRTIDLMLYTSKHANQLHQPPVGIN